MIEIPPALAVSVVLVGYSPGPANLFSLAVAVREGRRAALTMWLGLFVGYCCAATVCVLAAHFVGEAFGPFARQLKWPGAAYLVWLAWRVFAARGKPSAPGRGASFWSGVAVQLTNAKMILYELAVYSAFVLPKSDRLSDLFLAAALLAVAGPGGNLAWLLAGSALRGIFARHRRAADFAVAASLVACAAWLAFV